jgi:membrane protein DedA with SNARE-associated domain
MTVSSTITLILFLAIFGVIGAIRGKDREVWTLVGVGMTAIVLLLGYPTIEQLPVHIVSGILALAGNQNGSNDAAAHRLGAPWTTIMLLLAAIAFISIAYMMGQRFGKGKPETFGEYVGGAMMGALSGLIIAVLVFSQGALSALSIQIPNGMLTRSSAGPIIVIALIVAGIAFFSNRKSAAKS